jgi:short-subunit dehydrogenase
MSDLPPIAVVTGASSGIGAEYARAIARRGSHDLWLVARRKDRLERIQAEVQDIWNNAARSPTRRAEVLCRDLVRNEDLQDLFQRFQSDEYKIDFLINNAGFGSYTAYAESAWDWEERMLAVNMRAPAALCRAVLPQMLARRGGRIINVCSTAAYLPMPYMATYGATKAFLLNFSLALAAEVRRSNVQVIAHCPGPTESEFHTAAGLTHKLRHLPPMDTAEVVEQALQAADSGRWICVNGLRNRLLVLASRFVPAPWTARAVERKLRADIRRISAERRASEGSTQR